MVRSLNNLKKTKVITVLKPGKEGDDPADYRPISLLSITYKLFERLILNRIEPTINEILPKEQAAFRAHRSCDEQVLALRVSLKKVFRMDLKQL